MAVFKMIVYATIDHFFLSHWDFLNSYSKTQQLAQPVSTAGNKPTMEVPHTTL